MIVTLDGPAGAGKSSVARRLAERLGYRFLDTGAMYRAVALAAARRKLDWNDSAALAELARAIRIELVGDRVLLDGQDVTQAIRTPEVTATIRHAADNPAVRARLVELQREIAAGGRIVTEGRDQGTVAFPQAECKFFLTASAEERARRRIAELTERGIAPPPFAELLAQQNRRDAEDAARPVGALIQAADAELVLTDGLTLDQVVDRLERLVRKKGSP